MGTLYVVGTPIGNLQDLSPRAARTLADVSLIAAEDTRRTGQLLRRLGIRAALTSYHAHNWRTKEAPLIRALERGDVALVTDGGMPGVSDPGSELVHAARSAGHQVAVVPGPSAVTAALAVSGFPADSFSFLGFLPRRGKARREALERLAQLPDTVLMFEAPHRLRETLQDLQAAIADRRLSVSRELTKLHEEVFWGTAAEALAYFAEPRGEFTIVLGPSTMPSQPRPRGEEVGAVAPDVDALIRETRASGLGAKQTADLLAERTGMARKVIYQRILEIERR